MHNIISLAVTAPTSNYDLLNSAEHILQFGLIYICDVMWAFNGKYNTCIRFYIFYNGKKLIFTANYFFILGNSSRLDIMC